MDIVQLQEREARSRPADSDHKEGPLSPLSGIMVVDLSRARAPAHAALLLREMGARVVRIDPPGGGRWSPLAAYYDRGKESVALDLENPDGREAFEKLVARADILIQGSPAPEAHRSGTDYETLTAKHPRLIYCAVPPLADEGPLATRPADERVADAFAGVYRDQGSEDQPAVYVRLPIGAHGAALLAATGALAALNARRRTGRGQKVEASLVAGAWAVQAMSIGDADAAAGSHPHPNQQAMDSGYRLYRAADGWIAIGAATMPSWRDFLRAVGAEDLIEDPRFKDGPWAVAPEDQEELRARLEPLLARRPVREWERTLDEHNVPAALVQSHLDAMRDPLVAAGGTFVEVDDPVLGPTMQVGPPLRMSGMPPRAARPAPTPGRDTTRVLQELGYSDPAILRATSRSTAAPPVPRAAPAPPVRHATGSPPLDGLLVIDLAGGVAGSYAASLLADLGATVVKLEPLPANRASPTAPRAAWDRGKRSVALDLRGPRALDAAYRLTDQADVVVEDGGHGGPAAPGVDGDTAMARNPRLIVCSCPGFGPSGRRSDPPAADILLQARTGAQAEQGGPGAPPSLLHVPPFEGGAALQALLGILAALHARERTGRGQHVEAGLLHGALAAQAADFLRYLRDGTPDAAVYQEPHLDPRGPSPDRHLYRASDAWVFVSCHTDAHWAALLWVTGAPAGLRRNSVEPERVAAALQQRFEAEAAATWEGRLLQAGVPCAVARGSAEALQEWRLRGLGLVAGRRSAGQGSQLRPGVAWRFSETPCVAPDVAAAPGAHTEEVLAGLGLSGAEIAAIRAGNGTRGPGA